MKIKIFKESYDTDLEQEINKFAKDHIIINISYAIAEYSSKSSRALVIYTDDERY